MRKRMFISKVMCITAVAAFALTGCGSSVNSDSDSASSVTGIIQSIDTENNEITLMTMSQGSGDAVNGQGGQMEMPSGEGMGQGGQAPDSNGGAGGQAPDGNSQGGQMEMPSGEGMGQGGQAPDGNGGQAPDGNGQGGQMEMPSGEGMGQGGQAPDGNGGDGGQAPDGNGQGGQMEMPSGDGMGQGGQAPDSNGGQAPDGNSQGGQMEMPSGNGGSTSGNTTTIKVTDSTLITDADGNKISLSDLTTGTMVEVTLDGDNAVTIMISNGQGGMASGNSGSQMPGGGSSSAPTTYTSANSYTSDTEEDGANLESTGTDENVAWVSDGATVTFNNATVNKTSSDSTGGDNSSFYGVGASLLVTDGTLNVNNSTITSDSAGGAGVFAYGSGVANVSDTTITTTQDTSGGIHVAGGGTLNASNLTVKTSGESSAAIRSDRGGGTMTVKGGTYETNGTGSPAVYSTANISVSDATLTANNSEAVCIEGLNSLALDNCDVTSNMPDNSQNDCKWSIILYQSMSGDSEVGNSTFSMKGGSLTAKTGGLFYTTNTESTFTIEDVDITTSSTNDFFLKCTGNSNQRGWGTSGSNGATCTFTAINQEMPGDIIWDSISKLDLSITEGSVLTGAITDDESNAGNGGDGYANVTIDKDSKWIVTGDSTVTTLTNEGTIEDESGKTVTVKDTDGNVLVQGDSEYTIIVSEYK